MGVRAAGASFAMSVPSLIVSGAFKRADRELVFSAAAFSPVSAGNWLAPNQTADYWETTALDQYLHAAVNLEVGNVIKEARVQFYRAGATNPTIAVQAALVGATASTETPTVAWTNPAGTGSWGTLLASYSFAMTRGNYQVLIRARNIGDRVRQFSLTVGDP